MKLTMPNGFGVLGAIVVGMMLMRTSQAAVPQDVGEKNEPNRQAPAAATDAVPDIPVLVDLPESKSDHAPGLKSRPERPHTPGKERTISIVPRHGTIPEMHALGYGPDGVDTYILRAGVVIVSKSLKYGTIRIEAGEAVMSFGPRPKVDGPRAPPDGDTFRDDIDTPMKIRFKGNVVVHQDQGEIARGHEQRTVRAPEVEFDYVADRLLATDAKMEISAPGLLAPIKITSPRIEVFHPLERRPDGSLAPSTRREIRLDPGLKAVHD